MDILSYRGPSCPGGVSATLARLIHSNSKARENWWYLSQNRLTVSQRNGVIHQCSIPQKIIEGHYRFCNDFLWPVMHDFPELARFSMEDKLYYKQLNLSIATNILRQSELTINPTNFIQDYQLSEVPPILASKFKNRTKLFWHIPWPKYVPDCYVGPVSEVVEGLLAADLVGFHTNEYVDNFFAFVDRYLPDYSVDFASKVIAKAGGPASQRAICRVISQPLGIDLEFWKQESARWPNHVRRDLVRSFVRGKYVLSVDRIDYTKGVKERFLAIDQFFSMYPSLRKKITFVQIGQRSREGLKTFDRYWLECVELARNINNRWQSDSWQPIVWVTEQVSPSILTALYEHATAMLVNPVRDGLNLTAKEFVVCAGGMSGVLLLSSGAGVWHELGQYAIHVAPKNPKRMAQSIRLALSIPAHERRRRLDKLRGAVESNPLPIWWQKFGGKISTEPVRHSTSEILRSKAKLEFPVNIAPAIV